MKVLSALLIVVLLSVGATMAQPAELHVLSAGAVRSIVTDLAAAYEKETGNTVKLTFGTVGQIRLKLADATPADVAIMTDTALDEMTRQGVVREGTWVEVGRTGIGVGVRDGAPKPDISTIEAYKAALLAAKSIGYSRGCSGTNAAWGIEQLGLTEQLKPKTVLTDGGPVVEFLAKGDFELGIQQTNIMVGAPGTDYVGAPPGFLNKPCPSSIALMTGSKAPEAARALIKFIVSPEAAPLLRKTFVEPAQP